MAQSKQGKLSNEQVNMFYQSVRNWVKLADLNEPQYSGKLRDIWLSTFWKREPYLAGVIKSVVDIDKNRGWELVGGRNQVRTYSKILRNAHPFSFDAAGLPNDGYGWRKYFSLQAQSYYITDIGAISEVGKDEQFGPMRALWHVDPLKCELVNSIEYPLRFYENGNRYMWGRNDFMREESLPDINDTDNQYGFCAVSRILEFAKIMVAIYEHSLEKLLAKVPKGILLVQGINDNQWEDAMQVHQETLTAREREYYSGLTILFGDDALDAKLIALSQLPDGFELETVTNLMMFAYALTFGYDAREFFPVSGGSLGTGRETEIQAIKASGKGGLDFTLAYQDNLQRELPETLHWEFEQRNEQGEILAAEVAESWARAINEMAAPSGPGWPPTLTLEEKRQLLARRGLIPDDWTLQDEPEVATDTDSGEVDRYQNVIVRCLDKNDNEPIVKYSWPMKFEKVIFDPNKIRPSHHSIPGIYRTRDDYARRIRNLSRALFRQDITEFEFTDSMVTTITQNFRQAWVDGAEKVGFLPDEIEPEDYEPLEPITKNEFVFLPNLVRFIDDTRSGGGKATDLEYRILQWANRYTEIVDTSKVYFGKNQKFEWVYNPEKEHCEDCARLNGQIRRASFWSDKGLHPNSMLLQCGPGRVCGCELVPTKKPASKGKLPKIVGPGR